MRVRRVIIIGLLIFTTTVTIGCDYIFGVGPTPGAPQRPTGQQPSSGVSGPSALPVLPATGSEAPGEPVPSASPIDGVTLSPSGSDEDPDASLLPGDPFGTAEATYRIGTATLTVGDQVINLTRLAGPGTYFSEFGADVIWTGDEGWYVQVGGAKPNLGPIGIPAYIALDRVHDGQHWISWDPDGCQVTIDQADRSGVRGTATCSNMRWVDAIAGGLAEEPTPIAGQPPFGATITFQARP